MDMAIDEPGYVTETPPLSAHLNGPSPHQACATAPENLPACTAGPDRGHDISIVLIPAILGKPQHPSLPIRASIKANGPRQARFALKPPAARAWSDTHGHRSFSGNGILYAIRIHGMPPTCQQTLKSLTEEKDALKGGHHRICLRLGRDGTQHRNSGKTLRISIIRQRCFALINGILSDPGACRPMVEHDPESAADVAGKRH